MRVVVTCDWFLKYALTQSAALAGAGADVLLLCREHAHEFGGDDTERERAMALARERGVEILTIPGRLSDPRAIGALPRLHARLRRFAPDVVHAHDGADPRALPLLARRSRGPVLVLTVHDPLPHPGQAVPALRKRWLLHGSRDAWRSRARLLVVHSERLSQGLSPVPGQRVAVLAHGLTALSRPLAPPARPAVAFFGRLTAYKGLDVLARAMPLVWRERPEVGLHVAGTGPVDFELPDERVQVTRSYLPEAEFARFFATASLAVLPYTEASQTGAGSVAIGHGVPIVVSRVGGLPDLALDDSYVVAPGDAGALAAAIVRHLDDDAQVRERVLRVLAGPRTWDAVALRSLELYQELVNAA
ncbi:MAG: hypothetical protein QOG59_3032 [Solirubrobacteraceae bacterium]|nr:hypothetical protein [Solirubrobacteraceae bacterium]